MMNPRERFLGALRGRRPDRVPLSLPGFHFPTREAMEAAEDPGLKEIARRIFDETHCDVHHGPGVNRYLVTPGDAMRRLSREESGGNEVTTIEIDTPKGKLTAVTARNPISDTVWHVKYPVESLDDVEKIRSVRWEAPPRPASPKLPDDFERRGVVRGGVSSPFVCVAGVMPYQYFLELCATELNLVRELTALCLDRCMDVLDLMLADGTVDCVWIGGCEWLTPPMGSPMLYEQLVQKFEKPLIDRIHQSGALCHVHCHNNVRSTLELVISRGCDFFEPVEPPPDGDVTFAEAKEMTAGRMTLGGNIEARVLENESADAVEAAVRAAFEGTKERMVLQSTAGPIGPVTPRMLENYHRLIDVWEELSPIE